MKMIVILLVILSGLIGLIAVLDSQQRWFQARSQLISANKAKIPSPLVDIDAAINAAIGKLGIVIKKRKQGLEQHCCFEK